MPSIEEGAERHWQTQTSSFCAQLLIVRASFQFQAEITSSREVFSNGQNKNIFENNEINL